MIFPSPNPQRTTNPLAVNCMAPSEQSLTHSAPRNPIASTPNIVDGRSSLGVLFLILRRSCHQHVSCGQRMEQDAVALTDGGVFLFVRASSAVPVWNPRIKTEGFRDTYLELLRAYSRLAVETPGGSAPILLRTSRSGGIEHPAKVKSTSATDT